MNRSVRKALLIGAIMLGLGAGVASQANAGFGWLHPRRCAYAYWGWSCYTPCYTTWYVPYCGLRCWTPRYRVCWSCYSDPCCCDPCDRDPCGCNSTISVEANKAPAKAPQPTPAPQPAPAPAPAPKPAPAPPAAGTPNLPAPGASTEARPDRGLITIHVPADAQVTINGHATRTKGTVRQYASYGLKPGLTYEFTVSARVQRNGQTLQDVKTVQLGAGAEQSVAFDFDAKVIGSIAQVW